MKNRILAIFLSVSVFCSGFTFLSKRAKAAEAGGVILGLYGIFTVAWEMLDLMTKGEEPALVAGIRTAVENGIEGFENLDQTLDTLNSVMEDSPESQDWKLYRSWFNSLCEKLNADDVVVNDNLSMSLSRYKDMMKSLEPLLNVKTVKFECDYDYAFYNADFSAPIPLSKLPKTQYLSGDYGMGYSRMYYNEDIMIFPCYYGTLRFSSKTFSFTGNSSVSGQSYGGFSTTIKDTDNAYLLGMLTKYGSPSFYAPSLYSFSISYKYNTQQNISQSFTDCYVYDRSTGELTLKPIGNYAPLISKMDSVLCVSYGRYDNFIKSIHGVVTTPGISSDSLLNVDSLPDEGDISFPLNPADGVAIGDQVMIGDKTINDVLEESESNTVDKPLDIDIDVPTGLASKFPFCIPFDFVRILSIFAADPVAPVFRIPISTNPGNLGQWADNETVKTYLSGEKMFDIDEEIVIDFAHIPLVQPICYTCFIVGFIILLIHLTPKLIQH